MTIRMMTMPATTIPGMTIPPMTIPPMTIRAGACQTTWRGLPLASLDQVTGPGTCLILAPHPDDESLGCGGLIAACCAALRPPLVAILTDGAASHPGSRQFPPERLARVRAAEVRCATGRLGLPPARLFFCGCPDSRAPAAGAAFDDVVTRLSHLAAADRSISTILSTWRHDPHCDHAAAATIADAVAARAGLRHLAYPVWGWTLPADTVLPGGAPSGWRLDITPFRSRKRQAIRAHVSQYGDLITDDPTGFRLPADLLSVFDSCFETFLTP